MKTTRAEHLRSETIKKLISCKTNEMMQHNTLED